MTASLPGSAPDGPAAAARCAHRGRASSGRPFLDGTTASQNGRAPAVDVQGRTCTAATRPATSGTCCCRSLEHVQARMGWISEGALGYICERLTVPPADAYGVATFYGLLSMDPRPARRPARVRRRRLPLPGRRGADRRARGTDRTRGRRLRRLHLASQSVPRPVRPGAGGDADGGRRAPDRARAGGGHRRGRARRAEGRDRSRAGAGRRRPSRAIPSSGCCAASASSTRGACTTTARAAGTRRSGGRSRSARGT